MLFLKMVMDSELFNKLEQIIGRNVTSRSRRYLKRYFSFSPHVVASFPVLVPWACFHEANWGLKTTEPYPLTALETANYHPGLSRVVCSLKTPGGTLLCLLQLMVVPVILCDRDWLRPCGGLCLVSSSHPLCSCLF